MSLLVDSISNCLAKQRDGLVNFSNVAKLVADTSRGIPRLLQKGNLKDVHANLVNFNDGDERRVLVKDGPNYKADPRLAVAFLKHQRPDLNDAILQWESTYGRADIPQELSENAPELLRHLTSVFARDHFRCTFQDGKWFFCLNDVVQAATNDKDVGRAIAKVKEFDEMLLRDLRTHKFCGSTETSIVTIDVAARVWMLLPGRKASIFRMNIADLFIRVCGGDPRLAEQIKEIGEFQDQLPTNHPLRAFRDSYSTKESPTTNRAAKRPLSDITNSTPPPAKRQLQISSTVPNDVVSKGHSRPGQQKFRNLVIARVQTDGDICCEASGSRRDLDAAHIVPYSSNGCHSHGSWGTNGLLLHRSIHTIWDAGLVKLSYTPPYNWESVDKVGIEKLYGGLAAGIIETISGQSLRSTILENLTPAEQLQFTQNLKLRYHLLATHSNT